MRVWIKQISLENFQGHKKTVLDLHEGVNIIQGETHQGKSSIVRAIQSVFENNPKNPDEIIMDDEEYCKVILVLSNDYSITKVRREKLNKYIITYPNGIEETLKGFGTEVPQEILNILQAPMFKVDNSSDGKFMLNISSQLEPHFLLTSTGSIRAKVLTKITGGNIFDEAIKINNYSIQQNQQKKSMIDEEISSIKKELSELESLDDSLDKVNKLLNLIKQYRELERKFKELKKMITKLQLSQEKLVELKELSDLINNQHNVQNLYENSSRYLLNTQTLIRKEQLFHSFTKNQQSLEYYEKFIDKTSNTIRIIEKIEKYRNQFKKKKKISRTKQQFNDNGSILLNHKTISSKLNILHDLSSNTQSFIQQKQSVIHQEKLTSNHATLSSRIDKANEYINKLKVGEHIKEKIDKYSSIYTQKNNLTKFDNKYSVYEKHIESKSNLIGQLNLLPDITNLINQLTETQKQQNILSDIKEKHEKYDKTISLHENNINTIDNDLKKWETKLSSYDICPLCNQTLPHKHNEKEGINHE